MNNEFPINKLQTGLTAITLIGALILAILEPIQRISTLTIVDYLISGILLLGICGIYIFVLRKSTKVTLTKTNLVLFYPYTLTKQTIPLESITELQITRLDSGDGIGPGFEVNLLIKTKNKTYNATTQFVYWRGTVEKIVNALKTHNLLKGKVSVEQKTKLF